MMKRKGVALDGRNEAELEKEGIGKMSVLWLTDGLCFWRLKDSSRLYGIRLLVPETTST